MFANLKDALAKVSKSVGLLKSQDNTIQESPRTNTGSVILDTFEHNWAEIHNLNEVNANEASRCAQQIVDIHSKLTKTQESIEQLTNLLVSPYIKDCIDNCVTQVTVLNKSCDELEKELLNLEDLIEQVNFEKAKAQHALQLEIYKEKKVAALESRRLAMVNKYTEKVKEKEEKQLKMLQERQQVFQEAFKSDLELYKQHKTIPKIDKLSKPSALLEEIQLDYNQQELDKFLEE